MRSELAVVVRCIVLGIILLAPANVFAVDLAKGKTLFGERCATCHGPSGAGDGPLSQSLPAESKPRNLQTAEMKFATDDAKFKELLQKGGAQVGLNPLMPPAPGLSDEDLASLMAYVRSLKK